MHMGDALLSPAVGGAFLAVSGGVLAYSAHRISRDPEEHRVPLMGVLGAFVFAAQMINFTIPLTGSSGHLGGGMLLAILLGPYAGFLVMSSILVVQALLFADGGLLALGTNVFNLGVWPCFLGFLMYRTFVGANAGRGRRIAASVTAVVVCLELGALGVVMQTLLSGRTELPFGRFALLMLGIHLPIALVEGLVTAAVVEFVRSIRPGVVGAAAGQAVPANGQRETLAPVLASLAGAAVLTACVLSWFASTKPDGLEYSLEHARPAATAEEAPAIPALANVQEKTAVMPDYGFPSSENENRSKAQARAATSIAGLFGGGVTFLVIGLVGLLLYAFRPRQKAADGRIHRERFE